MSFLLVNVVDPFSGATASPTSRPRASASAAPTCRPSTSRGVRSTRLQGGLRRRAEPKVAAADLGRQRMGAPAVRPIRAPRRPTPRSGRRAAGRRASSTASSPSGQVRLARERVQRLERRLRHPAGTARLEDGHRRRLGDERRHPDRMGPRLRAGPLRHALRRLGTWDVGWCRAARARAADGALDGSRAAAGLASGCRAAA